MSFQPNELITTVLRHYEGTTGVTGWTKNLFADGATSAITVSVSEIGSGYYAFNFTPNADGYWHLDVYETADSAVHYVESFDVGVASADADTSSLSEISVKVTRITSDLQRVMQDINNLFVELRRLESGIRR